MMKFVLGLIVAILVALGIYTYSNQSTEKSNPTPSISEKKIEVKKTEKVSVVAHEVKAKKSSAKNITAKSPKVVSSETSNEMADEEEIGKGLTLEGIENADVSEEKKQIMIGEMLYYNTTHRPESQINSLSRKELYDQIHGDMKNINK